MTDDDTSVYAMPRDEVMALIREDRQRHHEEMAARAATPPAPPAPSTTPTAHDSATTALREQALAIRAEREQRAALVRDARDLLRVRFPERGYSAGMADDVSDEEALSLSGLVLTEQQQRDRDAETIYSDPAKFSAWQREKDAEHLEATWYHLAEQERRAECERLGIDYDHAAQQIADAWKRRGY